MRLRLGLFLLALPAFAGAGTLDELLDPGQKKPLLRALRTGRLARLPRDRLLAARGLDPRLWVEPPLAPNAVAQANNIRASLERGFDFEDRLRQKRRLFQRAAARTPLLEQLSLALGRPELSPVKFAFRYGQLGAAARTRGKRPGQLIQAYRHSERQFGRWWLDELAGRIVRLRGSQREKPVALLAAALAEGGVGARRAARVLAGVVEPEATRALEAALRTASDPHLLGLLVDARVRHGGAALPEQLLLWSADPREALRGAAVRACVRIEEPWVGRLLRERLAREEGRVRDDVLRALGEEPDGPVRFYGIATSSRRVAFCVDMSGSMLFPLDGEGGEREPRHWRTTRELRRTIEGIPATTEFSIVLFGRPHTFRPRLVAADDATKRAAIDFLEANKPFGGTNVHAALDLALRSGADTIFLLTDGEPSVGQLVDPALILEEIAARNPAGAVQIHTVGLAQDQDTGFLVNLAARNGGRYVEDR